MSKFGSYGRSGNMLFQWAFLSSLARKKGVELILPDSNIFNYFEHKPKTGSIQCEVQVNEPHYQYDPRPYDLDYSKNIDFKGYWQNEKYWDSQVLQEIKFKDSFRQQVRDKFYFELARPTIAIGIRRTDYLNEPHVYYQLSVNYFITALLHHFPDYHNYNLIFISDDPGYCKLHFGCLKNAFFPNTGDMEAMCLMSLCENIIMANSTFYWWAAKLGNPKKVIQPKKLFAGKLLQQYGDINFYSPDSEVYKQHGEPLIDISDVTFTIPVYYDHPDRKDNLLRCIDQLKKYFKCNIIVMEQVKAWPDAMFQEVRDKATYCRFESKVFHRTKMLNEMASMADTPYIANWDCDVVVPPMQIWETVLRLRNGAEIVYPYDGIFHRIRHKQKPLFKGDIGIYGDLPPDGTPSFGGALLWNKNSFMESGMENEYFISFGPEDIERMERAGALGLRLERTPGNLYHFAHWCGPDSSVANPMFKANRALLEKQRAMNREQLIEYIHSWPWYKPYTASYYESISEEATKSRDIVFEILGIPKDGSVSIVDAGCGVGQWGVGLKNYLGLDFNVPKDKLLVDKYTDYDLRQPIDDFDKADYCLCLEVAEHIEERYADTLIDNLCKLSDTIIFSAAIPYQGGTGHVNEQWQTYWRDKFCERGYYGTINPDIFSNENICLWYRQNIAVYKRGKFYPREQPVIDLVLPEYYEQIVKHLKRTA